MWIVTTLRRFYFARRNPSIRRPDFASVWRSHSDLLETMPSLAERFAEYTYGLIERSFGTGDDDQFDGIGAFRLAPRFAAMTEAERQQCFTGADPSGSERMRADEERVFSQAIGLNAVTAQDTVLHEAPVTGDCLYVLGGFAPRSGEFPAPSPLRQILTEMLIGGSGDLGRVAVSRATAGTAALTEIAEIWGSGERSGDSLDQFAGMLLARLPGHRAYRTSMCHRVARENA